MTDISEPWLKVQNLTKQFGDGCEYCRDRNPEKLEKNYCPRCGTVYACQNVSFEVYEGEILGVVGESGSGKSTIMNCLYFDEDVTDGSCTIRDYHKGMSNIFEESSRQKRFIRNTLMGRVYQNPMLGLKMEFSSMSNIAERLIAAGDRDVQPMKKRAEELLTCVNIPLFRAKEAPVNFSGGMQQRVQIAKALSTRPPVLLLDEVTTGLDLSVQANVLDLIKKLQRELHITMIVVSHDLGVIRMLAERTIVMLNGRIIEAGLTDQIMEDPQHEYTQQLVYSLL